MNKSSRIILRIEPAQREQFEAAAKAAKESVSEWLRDLGAVAVVPARKGPLVMVLDCANPDCPVGCDDEPEQSVYGQDRIEVHHKALPPAPVQVGPAGSKISPQEVANKIPGVTVGTDSLFNPRKPMERAIVGMAANEVPEENW